MADLRNRFGIILALALFPILLFSIYMAFVNGRILLVFVSILAWAIAFFSLWIATDKLVFSHLRKIQSASDKFAAGDFSARVEEMKETA
jgi:HAMP domain-containing protein